MLNHYNTHLLMIINGVWPSGKATGFGPVIPGSNPGAPAISGIGSWPPPGAGHPA